MYLSLSDDLSYNVPVKKPTMYNCVDNTISIIERRHVET
jgi:hypothetical protein